MVHIMIIMMCILAWNNAYGMEEVLEKQIISKLDAACLVATSIPSKQWDSYSLSSDLVAHIVRRQQGDIYTFNEKEEIACIEQLNQSQKDRLVRHCFESLKGDDAQEKGMHRVDRFIVQKDKEEIAEKMNRLQHMKSHVDRSDLSWERDGFSGVLFLLLIMEWVTILGTGIGTSGCWH